MLRFERQEIREQESKDVSGLIFMTAALANSDIRHPLTFISIGSVSSFVINYNSQLHHLFVLSSINFMMLVSPSFIGFI